MRTSAGLDVAALALGAGLALVLACGSVSSSSGSTPTNGSVDDAASGSPTPDASSDPPTPTADGGIAACDHYYAATYLRCGGPTLPTSEATRVRTRFDQVCANDMALPGSGMTPATVEACASTLDRSPCELPGGPPSACNFHGSLSGGMPCNEGLQCQSGSCQGRAAGGPGGQIGPTTCGTCDPVVAVGQVCASGTFSAGCTQDAICVTSNTNASMPTYTCTALAQGNVGAPCDDLATICTTGLYCSAQTQTCATLGGTGASCGEGPHAPGWPGGCAAPLSCVGLPGMTACSSGGAGAFCLGDSDCSAGLGCVPGPCSSNIARIGCAASGTCAPITWLGPGTTCDGYRTRCLLGPCDINPGGPSADGGALQGTCPAIVTDGQPCPPSGGPGPYASGPTCDTLAECFSPVPAGMTGSLGTCTLLDSTVCR